MKLVAQMLVKAGLTHLITVDLHQKEIQGFFDIPVDNLRASSFLLDYIQQQVETLSLPSYVWPDNISRCSLRQIPDWRNSVIVARTPNQAKRVTGFAERLKLNIAVIHGCQDRESESEEADGRNSPPPPPSGVDNLVPSLALGSSNYYSSACFSPHKYIDIFLDEYACCSA
jgi:phosphoribosylpyrophosphate synthetase